MAAPDPCVIVIFGASGDLTSRKLIPALYEMHVAGMLPERCSVLGVSRTAMTDEAWREELTPWARENAKGFADRAWGTFAGRLHYFAGDAAQAGSYSGLQRRIEQLSAAHSCGGNILFYLSVAPQLYEPIIDRIGESELVSEGRRWCSVDRAHRAWQRIIVEKPFGTDLVTAESLNRALGRVFEEDAIFRIDHFLGKELVQNLLVMRFANTIFEPLWNHQFIDHVQITASETVGVGERASYYDRSGAIRDMIQSHLLQVMALVAMEPPTAFADHYIRQEKVKVIDAIRVTPPQEIAQCAALGQYAAGKDEAAYHELKDVAKHSTTETFAAVKLYFDNWRWAHTPFYLRTGKRMAAKRTEVVIQFKQPAANLFRSIEGMMPAGQMNGPASNELSRSVRPANRIVIEIAPRESVSLRFEGKVPGPRVKLDSVTMDFDYARRFNAQPIDAYGPLIIDAMRGDKTLFKHRYEVDSSWRCMMPFLGEQSAAIRKGIRANYEQGSWGPKAADELMKREGRAWHNPDA
jgi:glucose-6-phosphate 1-dehydrogenase